MDYHHLKSYFVGFIIGIVLFSACKSHKVAVAPPIKTIENVRPAVDPSITFLKNVENRIWLPDFFNGKANINVISNGSEVAFDAIIQFRKDSAILLVAKKFGFEVGRALITPDSFFFINRIQQEYDAKPLSAIASKFNLPPRFNLIQHLIVGNPINLDDYQANLNDSLAVVSSVKNSLEANCFMDKTNFTLYRNEISNSIEGGNMKMNFADYRPLGRHNFSYQRNLDAKSKSAGFLNAELKFSEVELDKPKVIRFEIPKRYKRMD